MDTPELALIASEDGHVANAPSHPTSQYFDDSLFFPEQFENELPAQSNSQTGLKPHEMEWLSQSEDNNMQISCANHSGQNGTHTQSRSMSLNIPDTADSWADLMDLTPDIDFNDGTSEHITPFEADMNLLISDHNATGKPASKPRRVFIDERQKAILNEWIDNNPEPYPSKEDKMSLAYSTGLTLNQISSWFTRTRQRKLNRVHVTSTSMNIRNDLPPIKCLEPNHLVIPKNALLPGTHTSASLGILEGFWPSSISLPEHLGECPMRNPRSESRSLPALNFIRPCTSVHSPSSLDQLSLEALVSAGWSAASRGGNQETRKRLAVLYGDHNHHRSVDVTTKFDFIKVWIADVAQHKSYSSEEGDGMLLMAGPDATLTDSTNNDHGHVIGENEKLKESEIPEDPDHKSLDQHAIFDNEALLKAQRRIQNKLNRRTRQYLRHKMSQEKRDFEETNSTRFDTMSSAGSSASNSASSASSYMSFGPRRGRRVAFQTSQETQQLSNDAPLSTASFAVWSDECGPTVGINPLRRKSIHADDSDFATRSDESVSTINTVLGKRNAREFSSIGTKARVYPCTFCYKEFSAPFPWRRHESTAHSPQVRWVCGLRGRSICPICETVAQPGTGSFDCTHRFDECWGKSKSRRVFFRKDSLTQHIRVFHCKGDSTLLPGNGVLDNWKEEVDTSKYDLTCHFCGLVPKTWDGRALHLIKHFNKRIPLNLWIPQGPYALTPGGKFTYPFSASKIVNYDMHWVCPFDSSGLSSTLAFVDYRDSCFECILCGTEIDPNSEESRTHLQTAHVTKGCVASQVFFRAINCIEHLVRFHSAKQGPWMTRLLFYTLRKNPDRIRF
ncbi:hypothetical protein F4860DRAFT_278833 [Xylaria cubensis]|nr:hypothetical protein F4860DRAFT_278833 [Xylaria cubensis]